MFAIISVFALVAAYVAAEVPSYIHVCSRKDPKIDQCIVNNINNLKSKICKGFPELDIPSNDPFILDQLILSDTPNVKLYIRYTQLTGLCEFNINYLHLDFENYHFDIDLVFNQIRGNTTYDFDIRLLVPLAYKGQFYFTTDNVEAKVGFDMKIVTKGGKRYMYMAKMTINLDIKGYNIDYGLDNAELSRFNQIISNFIGNNQEEVIKTLKPAIEEVVSKRVLSIANNMFKHFTYEELLPE